MSAASPLQKAIFERLSADRTVKALLGPDGITDRRPERPKSPLLVIAAIDSTDHSTATERGEEHLVTLEIWSDAPGNKGVQAIAAAVRAGLDDAGLKLDGHALVYLFHRNTRISRVGGTRFHRADMSFRAVTEPKP